MSSETVPHAVTLRLPAEHRLVGLVTLRYDPEDKRVYAVGHRIDEVDLPTITPQLLRLLANELEIDRFREELDGAPAA